MSTLLAEESLEKGEIHSVKLINDEKPARSEIEIIEACEKQNIAFIVLHYGKYETSLTCVENLLKKLEGNYHIIIVDNASLDGSGRKLRERFREEGHVEVIVLDHNMEFSGGMNAGYRLAKEQGYRFVALINNDTLVMSEHICRIIWEDYEEYEYGVLGPYIETPDGIYGFSTNPYHVIELNDAQMAKLLEQRIQEMKRWIALDDCHLAEAVKKIEQWKCGTKNQMKRLLRRPQGTSGSSIESVRRWAMEREQFSSNCALHGSYLILGPAFVKKFEGLEQVTFLYGEEWLLYRRCRMEGLPIIYDPRIRIWHDEHTVQKTQTGSETEKMIKRLRFESEAYQQILEYIRKEQAEGKIFGSESSVR